ncbi:MAG: DUF1800 domain-containing protein [Pseudomonadota bacterium]
MPFISYLSEARPAQRITRGVRASTIIKTLSAVAGLALAGCSDGGGDAESGIAGSSLNWPTEEQAGQFLVQSTFGPSGNETTSLVDQGISSWLLAEFEKPESFFTARVRSRQITEDREDRSAPSDVFWESAVVGEDQLRLRMAYALSQILVVSNANGSPLQNEPLALAFYMDILTRNAFGNYRDLLEEVTYSPAMAMYLTYLRNRKANPSSGSVPDENYAREIMQLFTIGLVELGRDGLPAPGAQETYTNEDVVGLAKVFTGLSHDGGFWGGDAVDGWEYERLVVYPEHHSEAEKSFLGLTIPAGTGPEESIDRALDQLVNHPNTGPFIARQLIQRLVTSNPQPAYVERVATAFETGETRLPNDTIVGDGRRGDLRATIAAILIDPQARQDPSSVPDDFGKVREPVLRFIHWARAFNVDSARAQEERFLDDTSDVDRLGQHPFRSRSVFNFYRPGYVAPGTQSGGAGLSGPELQITNESTVVGYINTMTQFVRDDTPNESGASGAAFRPNYAPELELADDPQALVNQLNRKLTYGRMRAATRERIISVLNEIPIRSDRADEDRETRVQTAVLMAVTSPAFIVQQ